MKSDLYKESHSETRLAPSILRGSECSAMNPCRHSARYAEPTLNDFVAPLPHYHLYWTLANFAGRMVSRDFYSTGT